MVTRPFAWRPLLFCIAFLAGFGPFRATAWAEPAQAGDPAPAAATPPADAKTPVDSGAADRDKKEGTENTPKPPTAQEKIGPEKKPNRAQPPAAGNPKIRLNIQLQPGRAIMVPGGPQPANANADEDETEDAVVFAKDRDAEQLLKKARRFLDEDRFGEAARALGAIVEAPEDFFFQPEPSSALHRSLKSEAQQLLGKMPRDGRQAYELQFGARAEQMLADAMAKRDWDALMDVSRRFFHTAAGYRATYLLGVYHLDHHRPLAAALCFERLKESSHAGDPFEPQLSLQTAAAWRQAGVSEKARAALVEQRELRTKEHVDIAGREVPWFKDRGLALAWLDEQLGPDNKKADNDTEQWTMYRGDSSRNAACRGGMPLLDAEGDCWWIPNTEEQGVARLVQQLEQTYRDANFTALPALHPLAVDGVVLMRTVSTLLAVDFQTGKRLWNVPVDENWGDVSDLHGVMSQQGNTAPVVSLLDQRIWDDTTFGSLSSDGTRVFSIEDLNFNPATGSAQPRMIVLPNGRRLPAPAWPRNFNRLAAHDIHSGKLQWELGGPRGDYELPMAGAFFLGPPLPLLDVLYVLAELNGEIRVVAIEASTGKVQWGQQLAVVELDVLQDPARRFSGVSPSYSDGVLICPTGSGAVVALDLTTRSLLWGYRYQNNAAAQASVIGRRIGAVMMFAGRARDDTDRWMDSAAAIADDKVIITPIESGEVHCLNLLDGEPLWKKPRGGSLYVAGIRQGKILLVGRNSVQAVQLENGEPAWHAAVTLPSGSAPSGRGFLSGNRYYLPITSAEVIAIDIDSGTIVERSRSRKGSVPGNLLCYRGMILSQSPEALETFFELDTLKQQVAELLKHDASNPAALAQHGALALHDGDTARAVADLDAAYKLKPEPRTRELLIDALFDGLRNDFGKYADTAGQLEELVNRPEERSRYLRLMAEGHHQAGQQRMAFDLFAKLADPSLGPDGLERTSDTLRSRRDRWALAGLTDTYAALTGDDRAHADATILARFNSATQAAGPNELRHCIRYFGFHPAAQAARAELAGRLATGGDWLGAEVQWRLAEKGPDPEIARRAAVQLAVNSRNARRPEAVNFFCRQLSAKYPDVVCVDGKTGAQWVAELQADPLMTATLDTSKAWPMGRISKERDERQSSPSRYFPAEAVGQNDLYSGEMTVEMTQDRQTLVGRDGNGQERWKASLGDPGTRQNLNPSVLQVRSIGNLVAVFLGQQIVAVDTLASGPAGMARVLWTQELNDSIPGLSNQMGLHARQIELPWGQKRNLVSDGFGRPVGILGPLNNDSFCFQRGRELVAVDPHSGEILWVRGDVEPACEIFGDAEHVFVVAPNAQEAIVLRSLDGSEVGRRSVVAANQRVLAIGRRVVTWQTDGGKQIFQLFDPWEQQQIWRHEFSANSKAYQLDQEILGVVEPQGRFVAVNLADGRLLIDSPIEAEPRLQEIYLLRSRDRLLLFTNRPWPGHQEGVSIQAVPGMLNNPLLSGMAYGFDWQTGKKQWQARIEKQGLTLDQPRELPVLVFASRIYERQAPQGGVNAEPYTSIMCLDKRTGGVAYQERVKGHIGMFELVADPANHAVELKLLRYSVTMKFTDEPIPPEEAEAAQSAAKAVAPPADGDNNKDKDTQQPAADVPGPASDDQSSLWLRDPAAAVEGAERETRLTGIFPALGCINPSQALG